MQRNHFLAKFLIWRIKHLSDKNFVLILSGIIGITAGLAAVLLKEAVHYIRKFLTGDFDIAYANYLYIGYPITGITIAFIFTHYVLKEKNGHGLPQVLYAIAKKSSIIRRAKMYSSMLTSAFTVGFGGSVGLEAPIVVTGSAIGANIGHLMHLDYKKRTLLLGCGAAGAIAGIFNSPIAGVVFCMEVIIAELKITAFIPLLIASVAGTLVAMLLQKNEVLFDFVIEEPFLAADILYYVIMGVLCGLVSVYFLRVTYKVEKHIEKINNYGKRLLVGGVSLGLLIFIFPPIYGEGYNTVIEILQGREFALSNSSLFFNQINKTQNVFLLIIFVLGIILVKPVASALTVGAGGNGGVFGPSLFTGAMTGFAFALLVDYLEIGKINRLNLTLVGMCGVTSGVLQAPLTAIFLIAEISGGYVLFVPLMLVSALALATNTYFEKHSIYTKALAERGDLIRDNKDREVLSLIALKKIIEKDLFKIHPEATLNDLATLVRRSKRNIFPVVNEAQELMGIITLDDIREIMFDEELRKASLVKDLMHSPPASISTCESMESVMQKFEQNEAWSLPVLAAGKYVGFVSKASIFNAYRRKLINQNIE